MRAFRVTHEFHPLRGREFEAVDVRYAGHRRRVYYVAACGTTHSIPLDWTDLAAADPFVELAAGRSAFRVADLLEVADRLRKLPETATGTEPERRGPC